MVDGLMEVIVYVKEMQTQVAFYRDTLGLPVTFPAGLEDYSEQFWVTLDGGGCVLALHGGSQGRKGADAAKLVFRVHDILAAREALLEQGVAMDEVRSPAPGVSVSDGRDPEGNAFSIETHT